MRRHYLFSLAAFLQYAFALANSIRQTAWPMVPFATSGRWITDAAGTNVTYAGVNWPGAAETMLPEGLQYQSVEAIVSKIKSLGMNAIRLTYAIEMVDQIYDNNGTDIPIQTALVNALGQENGTAILNRVLANNPSFTAETTRLQVFDAVASECSKQQIYVHLDNHVSKASWCCDLNDGNTWWGDTYFDTGNWTRGLSYMASHGKQWPALVSMSLRNELRQPFDNMTLFNQSYSWEVWYTNMRLGAAAIHDANPDVLIFLSGLNSDTSLTPVVQGTALTPGTGTFSLGDFPGYADRLALEIHNYDLFGATTNCSALQTQLFNNGFQTLGGGRGSGPPPAVEMPLVMTEFGFAEDATTWKGVYASCLEAYLAAEQAGWMIWVLAGSYYVRQGTQDYDEGWGLLTHDWSDWRSPEHVQGGLMPLVKGTLGGLVAANTTTAPAPAPSSSGSSASGAAARWGSVSSGGVFSLTAALMAVTMLGLL